jgi:adenylyltransferase/sulfurtransferase
MFSLLDEALDADVLRLSMQNDAAGAFATFEGWVRNHNDGATVLKLEYEAFKPLAVKEANKIIAEAKHQFDVYDITCLHRVGSLDIGELAVWIGVTSAHRKAAFAACEYVIDEIKARLPIWKKEYYVDGTSAWVNCQKSLSATAGGASCASEKENPLDFSTPAAGSASDTSISEKEFYKRQVILPEIAEAGQKRLSQARVLVVGAGGLGCPVLSYLAGAGVGTIGICEFDYLETSNLHRQVLYAASEVGQQKAVLAANKLKALNPFVRIVTHQVHLHNRTIDAILKNYDLVVDCTDNFAAKFLLNDACVANKKPLVQSSIYQWEGQLHVYRPHSLGPCLRCLWPNNPQDDMVGNCNQAGVVGAVAGVFGSLQAIEALKIILSQPTALSDHVLIMDLLNNQSHLLVRQKNPHCVTCGVETMSENNQTTANFEVLPQSKEEFSKYQMVDIRETNETDGRSLVVCIDLPLSQMDPEKLDLRKDKQYLFFCAKGMRSNRLVEELRRLGHNNTYSLTGGISTIKTLLTESAK